MEIEKGKEVWYLAFNGSGKEVKSGLYGGKGYSGLHAVSVGPNCFICLHEVYETENEAYEARRKENNNATRR